VNGCPTASPATRPRGAQESRSGQEGRSEFDIDLDELVCEGARRVLAVALEEEVAAYIAAHPGGRAVSGSGSGR
jgi:hypothetical protein